MRRILFVSMLMLVFAAKVYAAPELKGSPEEFGDYLHTQARVVALAAEATMDISAKQGTVSIGVVTENASLKKALQTNQSLRNDIRSQLVAAGISQDRIVGTKFSSIPDYGMWGKKPKSYEVDNTLKITVENEPRVLMAKQTSNPKKD